MVSRAEHNFLDILQQRIKKRRIFFHWKYCIVFNICCIINIVGLIKIYNSNIYLSQNISASNDLITFGKTCKKAES